MNAQHTPTPWTAQEMPHGCNDAIMSDDGEGTTICEFPYGLDANADFIVKAANAHDDLAALVPLLRDSVLPVVSNYREYSDHGECICIVCELPNMIRAALAKAGSA